MTLSEFLECTRWMSDYEYERFIEDGANGNEEYYLERLPDLRGKEEEL